MGENEIVGRYRGDKFVISIQDISKEEGKMRVWRE